jgi:hypothetical protein
LNLKTFVARHWKITLLLVQLGLLALMAFVGKTLAEEIDSPVGP